jgi:proline racemase
MIVPGVFAPQDVSGGPPGRVEGHPTDQEAPMRSDRLFTSIDFHTAGIGMRLLTGGLGRLPGSTISEKRRHFQETLDHIRTGLCLEPRGHRGMLIAVMTEPVSPQADFGLFFMYPGGYYVSCGEATIGAATVAVETGMVRRQGAATPVVIDTEAGQVETVAHLAGDRVGQITLKWTPAFVAMPEQTVQVEDLGEVPLDISVGAGNVFAIVEAPSIGLSVRPESARKIATRGVAIRAAINEQLHVDVPGIGKTTVDNVIVHALPDTEGVSPNALVWGPGQVNAAPCGSGTCARMALLHHRGRLGVGGTLISEGLLGLRFVGTIVGEAEIEGRRAILPEITGTAYITGLSQFLFDPDDPVRAGFLLDLG